MTGEIALRGRVLPIGVLTEKVLTVHRAGIRIIILPAENEKGLEDLSGNIRNEMTFKCVTHADKVLTLALLDKS